MLPKRNLIKNLSSVTSICKHQGPKKRGSLKATETLKFPTIEEGMKKNKEMKGNEGKEVKEGKERSTGRQRDKMGRYVGKDQENVEETTVLGLLPGRKDLFEPCKYHFNARDSSYSIYLA